MNFTKNSITISVDCMGGDNAPEEIIHSLPVFLLRRPQSKFMLFGDESRIKPLVDKESSLNAQNSEIVHCTDVVLAEDKPSSAIRKRKDSSMTRAIESVRDKQADGIISAGNTGALMAISLFTLGTNSNIHRPAIIAPIPTLKGESCMLDMGANTTCNANNLVQFAILGQVYARTALKIKRPLIGILNIGSEAIKGKTEIKQAAEILANNHSTFDWNGYIEGNEIPLGKCDVVVTDGFTGNITLKTGEGVMKMLTSSLRESFNASLLGKIGYVMAKRQLQKLSLKMDPRRYNGAVLIGLNGLVVKSHGNTDRLGFASALGSCARMIDGQFMSLIENDVHEISQFIKC